MKLSTIALLLSFVAMFPVICFGITRQQAISSALEHNSQIHVLAKQKSAAKTNLLRSAWLENPSMEIEWEGFENTESFDNYESRTIAFEQVIPNPFRKYCDIAIAVNELGIAKLEARYAVTELIAEVNIAYMEWLASIKRIELREANCANALEIDEAAEKKLALGQIDLLERLQASIELKKAQSLVRAAKLLEFNARNTLVALIGTQIFDMPEDSLSIPQFSVPISDSLKMSSIYQYQLSQRNVVIARHRYNSAIASIVPDVSIGGFKSTTLDDAENWGIKVSANIPLWFFASYTNDVNAARSNLRIEQARQHQQKLELENDKHALIKSWENSVADYESYKSNVLDMAEKMLVMGNKSYAEGEIDYLRLLEIRRNHAEIMENYNDIVISLWKNWADIVKFEFKETN